MGQVDRFVRLAFGAVLFYFGLITQTLTDSTLINMASGIFGLTNIAAATIKVCPAYLFSGFSSNAKHITPKITDCTASKTSSHQIDQINIGEWSFDRTLLLSITLPVAVVLAIFTYLTFEQSEENKLLSETQTASAVAEMALSIESSGDKSELSRVSDGVAAIIFHDANGEQIPAYIERVPADETLTHAMLKRLVTAPLQHQKTTNIGDNKYIIITDSIPEKGMYVSVFYDTSNADFKNLFPLLTRLGFTALLAVWLSGWAAYYIIRRHTSYVAKNSALIKHRSTHDLLTGLLNRFGLEEILAQRISATDHRLGEPVSKPFALLIIDISDFHYFNDTLGHKLGDELLKDLAENITEAAGSEESVVRLNGDVFCVVTPSGYNFNKAYSRAEQLHSSICKSTLFHNIRIDVQCRIGMACYPEHTLEGLDLLRLGFIALEHAKSQKKNIAVYDELNNPHSVKRLTIITSLASAISSNQLYLAYQPKINIESGQLSGVEALIRWEHPVYENVSPFEFIGWAEKSGLINPLTEFVLAEAERQSQRWHEQGYDIPIAINLSPVNLHDDGVIKAIRSSVSNGSFCNGMLELEVTENAVVQELDTALLKMRELHSLGVPISIDDFGSGLASFSYLRNFPVSNLKIDQSFVNIDAPDQHDQILLRSMIELGHNLNCSVTAEGVETETTLTLLRELGCDYAQGYYICRPTSASGITDWLSENNIGLKSNKTNSFPDKAA